VDVEGIIIFLISNFRRVLYVVCFLLGNSLASEFYMPTFRNTLPVPYSETSRYIYLPVNMEQTECSEKSEYKIQTPGNYPKGNIQQIMVWFPAGASLLPVSESGKIVGSTNGQEKHRGLNPGNDKWFFYILPSVVTGSRTVPNSYLRTPKEERFRGWSSQTWKPKDHPLVSKFKILWWYNFISPHNLGADKWRTVFRVQLP
jgi:hypothetical protein